MSALTRSALHCLLAVVLALTAPVMHLAAAQPKGRGKAAPRGARMVVLAPLATLGSETSGDTAKKIARALFRAISGIAGFRAVPQARLRRALRKSREPRLRSCDGDAACLGALGRLLDAEYVVYGELGGLGAAQVVFLKLVEARHGREIRSTTVRFAANSELAREARAAAYRLLAPREYLGRIDLTTDVAGASVYLDGTRVRYVPGQPLWALVGTHALRVTHPEYRDFVRFVEIEFDEAVAVTANLQAYPIVTSDMTRNPLPGDAISDGAPPQWYRRWYAVAGFGAALLIVSAVAVGLTRDDLQPDLEEVMGD